MPDPERYHYACFGVERSPWAFLHPQVVWSALQGLVLAKSNPLAGGSEQAGLPADFLLDANGRIAALKYGAHADDQWSVADVLELVRAEQVR